MARRRHTVLLGVALAAIALVACGCGGGAGNAYAAPAAVTVAAGPLPGGLEVESIAPREAPVHGGTVVTITGAGFGPDVTVSFDQTPAASVQVSPDGRTLTVLTPRVPAPGVATLHVDAATRGGVMVFDAFRFVLVPSGPLRVDAIAPATGPVAGGALIAIDGNGFFPPVQVTVGGALAFDASVSDGGTRIVAQVPPGVRPGAVDVVVTTTGNGALTLPAAFTYDASAAPAASLGVSPATTAPVAARPVLAQSVITFPGARGALVRDLDGDARPEVVALAAGQALVYRNGGRGSLAPPVALPLGGWGTAATAADVDADGRIDLAVAVAATDGGAPSAEAVLRNVTPKGASRLAFAAPVYRAVAATPAQPALPEAPDRVAAADLDGDGRRDLILTRSQDGMALLEVWKGATPGLPRSPQFVAARVAVPGSRGRPDLSAWFPAGSTTSPEP